MWGSDKDTCLSNGFPWPLTQSEIRRVCGDDLLGLPVRGREVVYMACRLWEMGHDATVSHVN